MAELRVVHRKILVRMRKGFSGLRGLDVFLFLPHGSEVRVFLWFRIKNFKEASDAPS